jgi:hypothetical protein
MVQQQETIKLEIAELQRVGDEKTSTIQRQEQELQDKVTTLLAFD